MNRWSRWAQQLRGRHGRRGDLRASGSMVIASRPGSLVQILCAGPRSILHVHAHLRVTREPGPRLIGVRPDHARPAIGMTARAPVLTVTTAAQPAALSVDTTEAPASRPTAAAFLPVPELRTRRVTHETRTADHVVHIHDLVRQWRQVPADRVRALELITRLRAGSVRQEVPVPERAGVVARLRSQAPEDHGGIMPTALSPGAPFERMPSPAALAPVNVEALTTQVIQQLDRRLIAYRERMGRG